MWYVQTGNWKEAFERVIPLRKIEKKKTVEDGVVDEQETNEPEANEQGTDNQECTSGKSYLKS